MLYGHIRKTDELTGWLPEPLRAALDYLRDTDFDTLEAGRHAIRGDDIFALLMDVDTKPVAEARPEVHRDYIDVQCLLKGRERIGAAVDTGANPVAEDLLKDKDLLFYREVAGESMLEFAPGNFAIFFPSDAHRPCCAVGAPQTIRKVVVKVRAHLLTA